MSSGQTSSLHEVVAAGRKTQCRYPVLPVALTVVVCLTAIVFVRPHVGPWLEVRRAYWNLSSEDSGTRNDAIQLLRSRGEETESALIALLHHSDAGVRDFAAYSLSHEPTDNIIETFLSALESSQYVAEIGRHAPRLFCEHAEVATGPLTKTDRRMIAWLRSELNSANPDRSGPAAWALTAFVDRDPSLRKPVAAYLKTAAFFYKYLVLREMVDSNPSMRDAYIDVLLSGLGSFHHADQVNALYGLHDLRSRLESRRKESTDPGEISRIDQALDALHKNPHAVLPQPRHPGESPSVR